MQQYKQLIQRVLEDGEYRQDRTGTGTLSIFGASLRFNLSKGFPLVTTKKVHWPSIVHELLWFISGSTNIKYLNDNNVHIWDEWADKHGDLGAIYGEQWRAASHMCIDQLADAINLIKTYPQSRRIIVNSWQVTDLDFVALPPCHYAYQFYVSNDNKLSIDVKQRSCDVFLGLPFNIASYALLCHLVASVCGLGVGELLWNGTDVHIYKNHLVQCREQLTRDCRALPTVEIEHKDNIDSFTFDDIILSNYNPHPAIKGDISV